jgi:hypothetical protein
MMTMFEPLGTPEMMTIQCTDGSSYETLVYPSPISGLGLCKPRDDRRVAEWCVVHRGSGTLLAMARDGEAATHAASALGFAASSAGVFWENALSTVVANSEAMERCRNAVRVYLAP